MGPKRRFRDSSSQKEKANGGLHIFASEVKRKRWRPNTLSQTGAALETLPQNFNYSRPWSGVVMRKY